MDEKSLDDLGRLSGVSPVWTDHTGAERRVAPDDLLRILRAAGAIGDQSGGSHDFAALRADAMRRAARRDLPAMVTMRVGDRLRLPADGVLPQRAKLTFEDGETRDMRLAEDHDGYVLGEPVERAGYHRVELGEHETIVAAAPARCFTLDDMAPGQRAFGITAQVYGLRTSGDGGVGSFAGVEALALAAAARGADALALSPTHALFSADPSHFSPYSPSTRLFANPLHADPSATFGPARIAACLMEEGLAGEFAALEALELIDWPRAARAKTALLRSLFASFETGERAASAPLAAAFDAFVAEGGDALRDHARFEALHGAHFRADFTKWDWRSWPDAHRDPRSQGVEDFARAHAQDVSFHLFAQWLAARSQAAAQRAAREAGMRIGLIADLAVGMNAGGSHAWSRPQDLLVGLSVGAPPDPLAPRGQNWGLTGLSPRGLAASGHAPFIATLRAALRAAGGLRIDHVMGLARLWVIPEGEDASHGAYLAYPFEDLLNLVALESWRHRAIVIGEDLGTVPHGFRERMEHAGVYGMRVAQFERNHERFYRADWYPPQTAAMSSTHDLSPIAGYWAGADLDTRAALDQFGPGQTLEGERAARTHDRAAMWANWVEAGVAQGEAPPPQAPQPAADAAVAFLARSASRLALAPVEDLIGQIEAPNLPGTTTEHPNWRRRYAPAAARLLEAPGAEARLAALRSARGR